MHYSFGNIQTHEDIKITLGDHVVYQVNKFKYLVSIIQENCKVDGDINNIIQANWFKWRKTTEVICDHKVQNKLMGKF